MRFRKFAFAAVLSTGILSSLPASASCYFTAQPTHIYTQNTWATTVVYLHNGQYFTYFHVPKAEPELLDIIRDAATAKRQVSVRGTASACAASGQYRYGGYAEYVFAWTPPGS